MTNRQPIPAVFSWRGRVGRLRFWATVTHQASWLGWIFAAVAAHDAGLLSLDAADWVARVGVLALFPAWWMTIYAGIRRWHDIGLSGWWSPALWTPAGPLVLLVMGLTPGTREANRFGPRPA